MKVLIVLCALAACAYAKPGALSYALGLSSPLGVHLYPSPSLGYSSISSYSSYPFAPLSYSAPSISYSAPALSYSAPSVSYSSPALSYSAPSVSYSSPALSYSAPRISYSSPALSYSAPAAPIAYAAPAAVPATLATKSQYHAQDELGQASYGHAEPTQSHNAVQDAHGNKIGSFSYTAPDGRILRTDYVADALGYRVASNALPVAPAAPVADTPEVTIARAQHLAEHHRRRRSAVLLQTPASTTPLVHPIAYSTHIAAPIAYSSHIAAPVAYSSHITAPIAYSSHIAAPVAYSSHITAPVAYTAPLAVSRAATLTQVVNNPGHAVSYRVD